MVQAEGDNRSDEIAFPLERVWVNPTLQRTARWLLQNGVREGATHVTVEGIWSFQGYTIPIFTGQDLPVGIAGKTFPDHPPELTLFVPEPNRAIPSEDERNLLPTFVEETLRLGIGPQEEVLERILQDQFDQRYGTEKTKRGLSTDPRLKMSVVYETGELEAIVSLLAASQALQFLGVCQYDIRAELEHADWFTGEQLEQWLRIPNPDTFGKPPQECIGNLYQEMNLREMVSATRYGLHS